MKNIFIVSVNSDIASHIVKNYKKKNWNIYGTYKTSESKLSKILNKKNFIKIDLNRKKFNEKKFKEFIKKLPNIDIFTCLSQTQKPFGKFYEIDFNEWENSFFVNFLNPVKIFNLIYKKMSFKSCVIFFTGGGPNKATKNFSGYALSKFLYIKFSELLAAEDKKINFACINPGWVKTKAHDIFLKQTYLKNTEDYKKLKKKIKEQDFVNPQLTVNFFNWFYKKKNSKLSGRYYVLDFDNFSDIKFEKRLAKNNDVLKMRRKELK
jgi:short-subunit dehydrogenase